MCFKFIICKSRKKQEMLRTTETCELLFKDRDKWKLIAITQQNYYTDIIKKLERKVNKYKKERIIDLS